MTEPAWVPDYRPATTFEDVVAWLGPGHAPATVEQCYESAEAYVGARTRWPADQTEAPADLKQAVRLQTARLLARRGSPDGFVGLGDLGVARVPITDRDVQNLLDPWRPVVMA